MSVERPSYDVLEKAGSFELRRYETYLVANVRVPAEGYNEAVNAGFGVLADYIFGNNAAAGTIPMTAPVTAGRSGERIPMTVPVTSERERSEQLDSAAALCTVHCPGEYLVTFTMPSRYRSVDELPTPNNPRVELAAVPARLAAVAQFGGYLNETKVAEAVAGLRAWIDEQGLVAVGEPVTAQYDSPWKPGFVRHNEVLIDVEEAR